jgi:DNA polymerase-3 subunit delta
LAAVKSEQFEAFFLKPPRGLKMILLHGPESDLVSERARRLAPKLADEVVRLSADALGKDPGRLADEASAISMFGDKRVLWIDAGGRDLSALIAGVANTLPDARARRCARCSKPGPTRRRSSATRRRPPASDRWSRRRRRRRG